MGENSFGDWLAEQQKRLKISDTKLAALIGVTAPTISRWKSGVVKPREPEMLDALASAFEVDRDKVYALAGRAGVGMNIEGVDQYYVDLMVELQNRIESIEDQEERQFALEQLTTALNNWWSGQEQVRDFLKKYPRSETRKAAAIR